MFVLFRNFMKRRVETLGAKQRICFTHQCVLLLSAGEVRDTGQEVSPPFMCETQKLLLICRTVRTPTTNLCKGTLAGHK